jgi:hypothetical protein
MSRLFGIFLILLAAVLGWIISERERPRSPPSASTSVAQGKATPSRPRLVPVAQKTRPPPEGPIAEFDLAGSRRAKPCPTMGALEAESSKSGKPTASEKRCAKIPARRPSRRGSGRVPEGTA